MSLREQSSHHTELVVILYQLIFHIPRPCTIYCTSSKCCAGAVLGEQPNPHVELLTILCQMKTLWRSFNMIRDSSARQNCGLEDNDFSFCKGFIIESLESIRVSVWRAFRQHCKFFMCLVFSSDCKACFLGSVCTSVGPTCPHWLQMLTFEKHEFGGPEL